MRDCFDGFKAVRAFGDDLAVLIGGQELAQQLTRGRFVVNDYDADHRGNSITTRNCPSASAACSWARPSETALRRPRAFSMPMPSPRASARSGSAGGLGTGWGVGFLGGGGVLVVPPSRPDPPPGG